MSESIKLSSLLDYISKEVPFYSNVDCRSFEKIPIIDKKVIKSDYSKFIANDIVEKQSILKSLQEEIKIENYVIEKSLDEKYVLEWTTGTSGIPFKCVKSKKERKQIALALWRRRLKIDKRIGVQNFYPFIHTGEKGGAFDIRDYTTDNIRGLYEYVRKKGIICIHTTPNLLKRHIEKSNLPKEFFKGIVPYIEVTGHYLTLEDLKLFEEIFQSKILNLYGLIEVWGIGYTCRCGKMHIISDNVKVEIINERGEDISRTGGKGEIVVTSLIQRVMPFVRYRTGDVGHIDFKKCECGNPEPILMLESMRNLNGLYIDGKYEDGISFTKRVLRKIYWIHDFSEITNLCLIQKGEKQEFCFILNEIKEKEKFEEIARSIMKSYMDGCIVMFKYVSDTEYDRINSKAHLFMSKETWE